VTFTPTAPFAENALIEVFLSSGAQDVSGNPLSPYHGSFRTVNTAGAPSLVRFNPSVSSVALNPRIEAELSEPLDAATVDATNVKLLRSGTPVAGAVALVREGRVVRFTPDAALQPNTFYTLQLSTGVRDLSGTALTSTISRGFTTGTADDVLAPVVSSVAPPDGVTEVGVNTIVRLRFSERLNPLSVTGSTVRLTTDTRTELACTISFSNNDRDVVIEPHGPLADLATYSLRISGVEDLAGNAVPTQTTSFTTSSSPDFFAPVVVRTVPQQGATGVPLNSVIELQLSEPIDAGLVDSNTFRIRDNTSGVDVAGTRSVDSSARTLTFVPDAPLAASHSFGVFGNVTDLANNLVSFSFGFTTGADSDVTPPQVALISPADGSTDVPTNVDIGIRFNEAIQTPTVAQFVLTAGGPPITVQITEISDGNRFVRLRPRLPLGASLVHTLMLVGIKDLAGNALAGTASFTFTTAAGADLSSPSLVSFEPTGTGVGTSAVVQVTFNERVDPTSIGTPNFRVFRGGSTIVTGTVSLSADGRTATFTPSSALAPNTSYSIQIFSYTDLAGNLGPFQSWSFTTGP
jgi:hypothetical protein